MSNDISATVDAKGLICPEPVMMLHNAVRDAVPGALIQVLATDPSTQKDIQQFCEFLDHRLISHTKEEDVFVYVIQKNDPASSS